MTRSKTALFALLALCLVATPISAYNGDSLIQTIQDTKWARMTSQGGPQPIVTYHTNLLVDCDSSRIFFFGSELEATYATTVYNNNSVYIWNLKTFIWRPVYPDDVAASYRKLSSPLFGGDTSKFWAVCSTGHPVPTHVFDAAKYIPGKNCFLVNVFPDHNATVANALNPGVNATPGNCRGLIGQPSSWLFDTKTLRWTQLKNALSPNPWQSPMGVSVDGETVIQLESNGDTWHFNWADSTWVETAVTGTKPAPVNACLEYDTYLHKFICVGGSTYSLSTYDPVTHVWTRLSTVAPADMNGCHTGYDTLNKVLLVHAPYGTTTGYSATLAWHSETAVWDTVRRVADGKGTIAPYEGFGFKGEFDLKRNVFYYMKDRDFWCFRYDGYVPPNGSEAGLNTAVSALSLAASPNPFTPATMVTLGLERESKVSLGVFNANGQKITALFDGTLKPGSHGFHFSGHGLPSGVYAVRAETAGAVVFKRVLLVR